MASCNDLEGALRDMRRRIAALEQCTGCGGSGGRSAGGGGANTPQDIEEIIRKAVDRVFKDNRWLQAVGILGMLSTGKAGITSLGGLQSPASAAWQRGVESLNRSFQAQSAAGAAKGKAQEALSKSLDAQLKSKAAREAASKAGSAAQQAKAVSKIAKDEARIAKNAANGVKQTAEQAKKAADASKALSELNKKNIAKEAQKVAKEVQEVSQEINKKTKPLQDAYKKLDDGFQRITKGLDKFANAVGLAFGIAGVAIGFMALFASERNQAAFDRQVNAFNVLASKELGLMQQLKSRIDKVNKRTEILEKEADLASDAIKQNRSIADAAKKQANDITYEARVKLQRLNDGLYIAKTQAARADEATKQFNTKIQQANVEIAKANSEASKARVGVQLVDSKATLAAQDAKQARIGVQLVDSKATTALTTAQQLPAKIPILAQPAIQNAIAPIKTTNTIQDSEIAALKNNVRAIQNVPKTNTGTSTGTGTNAPTVNQAEVNRYVNNSISGMGILPRLTAVETTAGTALQQASAALNKPNIEPIGNAALGLGTSNKAAIDRLNQDIQQLKAPNILEPRLRAVETKVQEQERVNQEANQKLDFQMNKLDQLIIASGGIDLMLPRILGSLEGLPDKTASAVAATPCNGKGCGGRTAQRVDGIDNRLKDMDDRLNAFNTAANTAQLRMLKKIDATTTGNAAKLGIVQGALSAVGSTVDKTFTLLDKFAKWSRIGRAFQVLQTWMLLHNALMLSNDLKVTLVAIVQNGYDFFKIKDENGEPIDVNQQLNQTIVGLIDGAIGKEARIDLTIAFRKANRIYQAMANGVYAITSFVDIGRQIAEIGAERIGKVANALRAWGTVSDKAYGYMSEVVTPANSTEEKIQNLYSKVEPFQNALNTIEIVSTVPQQTVDAFTNLATAEKELELARQGRDADGASIEQQVKEANKSPEIDDPVSVGRPD